MNDAVLVVDDDPTARGNLQRFLNRRGYAVETAETAEEALLLLEEKPFCLVITDWQMPGMDGLELLERIKKRSPQVPVVMITGYESADTVIQALRKGVSDFLLKPFRPLELAQIVEREVARYRQSLPAGTSSGIGAHLSKEQLRELEVLLAQLRLEIDARCTMLIESNGHILATKGYIEEINLSALAALVAGDLAASSGIASLLGEDGSFRMNYHEGERYNAYSAQVTPEVFLLIVFGPDTRLGIVLHFARQIVPQLQAVLGRTAPSTQAEGEEGGRPAAEIKASGILEADILATLEAEFARLWKEEG